MTIVFLNEAEFMQWQAYSLDQQNIFLGFEDPIVVLMESYSSQFGIVLDFGIPSTCLGEYDFSKKFLW